VLLVRLPAVMKGLGLRNLKKYFKIIILWFSTTATEKETSEGGL
jgi:hypothetical protein